MKRSNEENVATVDVKVDSIALNRQATCSGTHGPSAWLRRTIRSVVLVVAASQSGGKELMMDENGHIYELSDAEKESLMKDLQEVSAKDKERIIKLREDVARLDGYLKARAEADAPKRR